MSAWCLPQSAARLAIQKPSQRSYQFHRHGYDLPFQQLSREARHYFVSPDMVTFISSYLPDPYLVVSEIHVNANSTEGRKPQDVHWDYLGRGVLTYMLMLNPNQGRHDATLSVQSHCFARDVPVYVPVYVRVYGWLPLQSSGRISCQAAIPME